MRKLVGRGIHCVDELKEVEELVVRVFGSRMVADMYSMGKYSQIK